MTDEVKDDIKDLPQIEEQDGSLTIGEEKAAPVAEEDESLKASSEDESEEQGHAEETAEEAEARRERNRKRRHENKERRKDYIESLKRELASRDAVINDLSTRVASVEKQSVGSQMAQVDVAIKEAEQYYNHFKQVNRQAIEQADGNLAVDAQEKMFAAQQRYNMLQNAKKQMTQQQVQRPQPLDPRMKQYAEDWMGKNEWYDPSGEDLDSDLVLKLDDRLVQEGWDPKTSEYWEELDSRVKKYLPHRFNSSYNKPQQNGQTRQRVPVSGGSSSSSSGAKGTYHLSAERVKALKEAGVYDDPVKRADAIKRFQEFDKQQAQSK
jgi:hypothetical protein